MAAIKRRLIKPNYSKTTSINRLQSKRQSRLNGRLNLKPNVVGNLIIKL